MLKQLSNYKLLICLLTLIINITPSIAASNEPVLLSNPGNTGFERFRIDPSNQYVVFNELDQNGVVNRFSSKIDGKSPAIEIASNLSFFEDNFFIDADDSRVFFRDDDSSSFISTEINGDNPVIYSYFNTDLQMFESRGSSLSVISSIDRFFFFTSSGQLISSPSDGNGTSINYTETLNTTGDGFFRLTNDRQRVFFSTQVSETSRHQLFSTNVDGNSDPVFITELPENTDVDFLPRISADDQRVVYVTETFLPDSVEILQLFSAPLDGSTAPVALSAPFTGQSTDIDFFITDDSSGVVFITEEFTNDVEQIFFSPIDGSVEPTLIDTGTNINQFEEVPGNETLVYSITEPLGFSGGSFIRSIPINAIGQDQPNVLGQLIDPSINFAVSEDGNFVFFAEEVFAETRIIFRASIDDSSPLVNVVDLRIERNSDLLIVDNKLFFIGSPLDNQGTAIDISNDGRFAVYTAVNDFTDENNLFSVSLEKAVEPLCFPIKAKNDKFVTICL